MRSNVPRCLFLLAACCILAVGSSFGQDVPKPPDSNPLPSQDLKNLAIRILKRADQAKCLPKKCAILVANFTTPSGSTSHLGIQLADFTSAELLSQGTGIEVVNRNRLSDYLIREHIPSAALKDRAAARWLATEFQANVVLLGTIEELGDHYNLLTELLNVSNDKVGPQEAMQIAVPEPREAFAPFEPYDAERPQLAAPAGSGSPQVRAGVNGVGIPSCIHCPAPQYSNAARKAKFFGTVVLDVTVSEDGRATDVHVLKGVPFGLNEQSIRAVNEWTFRPASSDGVPAAVHVPIEMTFRLY